MQEMLSMEMMREYELAVEKDKKLRAELAEKQQELERLEVLVRTDYVDLLEQARKQYDTESAKLQDKRSLELCSLMDRILREEAFDQVTDILKLLHKLKKYKPKVVLPEYFLQQREFYLVGQRKYLGEDVKKWTAFIRGPLYTFLFQMRTLFPEEADEVIIKSAIVPRILGEYIHVIRRGLSSLKSSLEYSTLWTLFSLTDKALSQVGAPFLILLVPAVRDAYVSHLIRKGASSSEGWNVMAVLNEWRHFRPSFAETAIRVQINRHISTIYSEDTQRVVEAAIQTLSTH